ncbi:MAG: peptidoglycan-associated lipoprotein, partial [Nitratireductor sp.]|nr:peptidoglycan-associated lipoprotein [Nitratireductor sp.]
MQRALSLLKSPAIVALAVGLALAGCAKQKLPDNANGLGLNNGATPGTQQDFTVNVGDRIFFETDSSALTSQARETLDRQAQWLARYTNYP